MPAISPDKLFKEQFDDEEVLLVFRKHPVVMRKGLVIASLALLIGPLYTLVLTYVKPNNPPTLTFFGLSFVVSIVLAIVVFMPFWIGWHFSVYIVTDQRLIQIHQRGLFHRSMVGLGLNQIQMVNYEIAGLQETLLGFGTIMIQTFVGSLTIHEVHKPALIQKELLEILREQGISASSSPMDGQQADEEVQNEEA
ncbi:hypothetical protein BH10PAT3_BH10PAT3_8280 [soil metagenome]